EEFAQSGEHCQRLVLAHTRAAALQAGHTDAADLIHDRMDIVAGDLPYWPACPPFRQAAADRVQIGRPQSEFPRGCLPPARPRHRVLLDELSRSERETVARPFGGGGLASLLLSRVVRYNIAAHCSPSVDLSGETAGGG